MRDLKQDFFQGEEGAWKIFNQQFVMRKTVLTIAQLYLQTSSFPQFPVDIYYIGPQGIQTCF